MVDSAKTVLNDVLQQEKGPSGSGPRLSLNQASLEENLKSLYDAIEKVKVCVSPASVPPQRGL
jgi:hypothetical protein